MEILNTSKKRLTESLSTKNESAYYSIGSFLIMLIPITVSIFQ